MATRGPDPAARFRPAAATVRRGQSARARPGAAVIAAGLVAALILAWLVFRTTVASALAQMDPGLALAAAPEMPEVALSETAAEAVARAPLSEEPLVAAARASLAAGDTARADALLARAYARNPRSRQALLLRIERQIRTGRMEEAVYTMAALSRLLPDASRLLTGELARMAAEPELRESVAAVIGADPNLREALLEELARKAADPDLILALAGPQRPGAPNPAWHGLLVERLVEKGEIARARAVWSRLTGAELADGVYDPDFTGMPGPVPFNWDLEANSEGFAELSQGSPGLYAEFYARGDTVVARQLIGLSPGRHTLRFDAEGDAAGTDGYLYWTLSCHPGGTPFARIPVRDVGFPGRTLTASFTVPSGCPAQWLKLEGKFAEYPKQQQATIRNLRIERAGS